MTCMPSSSPLFFTHCCLLTPIDFSPQSLLFFSHFFHHLLSFCLKVSLTLFHLSSPAPPPLILCSAHFSSFFILLRALVSLAPSTAASVRGIPSARGATDLLGRGTGRELWNMAGTEQSHPPRLSRQATAEDSHWVMVYVRGRWTALLRDSMWKCIWSPWLLCPCCVTVQMSVNVDIQCSVSDGLLLNILSSSPVR